MFAGNVRGRVSAGTSGYEGGSNTGFSHMMTVEQAKNADFWRGLNPGLQICGVSASSPQLADANTDAANAATDLFATTDFSALSDRFWDEGYFLLHDILPAELLARLRAAIEQLIASGLPPAMIYLYDEAWQVFSALRPLLTHFLGEKIALLPHFWAWHVDPRDGGRGWPPHRDYQGESAIGDDMLISLSLWVPLSDATPENGCMYVLPRSFERWYDSPVTKPQDVVLQDVRALPAGPGAVMGWRQDVYHWGSRASRHASSPRISLSLEFQNAAFDPLGDPLLDLETPPSFDERLLLIAGQFEKYRHMQNMDDETLAWCQAILKG
ncbi:phytanoyl-CoA dioxygenase family protein [Thalassospira marina]|nr:phytanoyl-CoA dioxygenase family protein [Thalassospira marina]